MGETPLEIQIADHQSHVQPHAEPHTQTRMFQSIFHVEIIVFAGTA